MTISATMDTSTTLLNQALQAIRAKHGTAYAKGIELIGIVGSVARGEAKPDSDVDVAYRVIGRSTLFDLGEILMDLQDELGLKVDMMDLGSVKPRLRAAMEHDLVRI